MLEHYSADGIPDNVREMPVTSDPDLSTSEKELRIVGGNDEETVTVSSEIPTIIKWLQSIEESDFQWVRVDTQAEDDPIVGCCAEVPKGVVKLQSNARKSNNHSQMVAYGPARGANDDE